MHYYREGVITIAEYDKIQTFRLDTKTTEGLQYLHQVFQMNHRYRVSTSEILRILIQDAVARNAADQYYRQHKNTTQHTTQESTE